MYALSIVLLLSAPGLFPWLHCPAKGLFFALWWLYGALHFVIALPHSLILRNKAAQKDGRHPRAKKPVPTARNRYRWKMTSAHSVVCTCMTRHSTVRESVVRWLTATREAIQPRGSAAGRDQFFPASCCACNVTRPLRSAFSSPWTVLLNSSTLLDQFIEQNFGPHMEQKAASLE